MAEEPAPEEQEALSPFFDVSAAGGTDVRVRAGWVNEESEVHSLVMDYAGGVSMADQAFDLAYSWYINVITAMLEDEA